MATVEKNNKAASTKAKRAKAPTAKKAKQRKKAAKSPVDKAQVKVAEAKEVEEESQEKLAAESTKARVDLLDQQLDSVIGKKAAEKRRKAAVPKNPDELRPVPVGAWVILGHTKNVDERFQGHEAMVTNAPLVPCTGCKVSTLPHTHQAEDTVFTVRTRDQYSAEFTVGRDDFEFISWDGRVGLPTAG